MKRLSIINLIASAVLVGTAGCVPQRSDEFVRMENGHFIYGAHASHYYYIGANLWYGPFLATEGPSCDRARLCRELDRLHRASIDNLRIAVGAEGSEEDRIKVKPILQTAPGNYNDAALDGLDFLMAELGKRGMHAVLYLTNSWTWSGGYVQYLAWSKEPGCPIQSQAGWNDSIADYASRFHRSDNSAPWKRMLDDHIRFIVTRTNRYTGKPYNEDPALFAWQLCNEPRAFSNEGKEHLYAWIAHTAKLIKSLDPNHMVSTGSEGEVGSENDIALWKRIHAIPEIDYATIHIWPYNWRWVRHDSLDSDLQRACINSTDYIRQHLDIAYQLGKPLVIEEFGYPRDNFSFEAGSSVAARDAFYRHIFETVVQSAATHDLLAGCNFWGWGGAARPQHLFWQNGDDYCNDPAQEEQGLYSVFDCDTTTIHVITNSIQRLKQSVLQ